MKIMAGGAYKGSPQFGPIYTRSSSPMRRKFVALGLLSLIIITLFYLDKSPKSFERYTYKNTSTRPKSSSSITKPTQTTTVERPDYDDDFPEEFPKNIWQTGSDSQKTKWEEQTGTWIEKNPDWKYELLTDESNTQFVHSRFSNRPALISFWNDLNVTILRADLIRYLTMFADGGVYADMDTSCLLPISSWIPLPFQNETINAIVGVEYDDTTYRMFVRPVSFSQWTLMSKPQHPIFEKVIYRVIYHLEYLARIQATSLSGIKIGKKEVLEATGPGAFSDAVMEVLTEKMGRKVDWSEVQRLREAKLFGDVLILPINGFGGGQKHSHSGQPGWGEKLVQHHFGRSWYTRPTDTPVVPVALKEAEKVERVEKEKVMEKEDKGEDEKVEDKEAMKEVIESLEKEKIEKLVERTSRVIKRRGVN